MDQNLKTDAETLTKTLCGHLAAAQLAYLTAAAKREARLGVLEAPLANGQMGHVLDYDDTHMGGVVLHTSSPVLAALFALAERAPVSGADFMLAYATGFEAGVRPGRPA